MSRHLLDGGDATCARRRHLLCAGFRRVAITVALAILALSIASGALAEPVFRGQSNAQTSSSTTLATAAPAAVVAGDFLVADVDVRISAAGTIAPPTGWTRIRTDRSTGSPTLTQEVYGKVAGSSEPSRYTWGFSESVAAAVEIVDYAGVDTANPVDAQSGRVTTNTKSIPAPSITTTAAGDVLIGFFGAAANRRINAPAGMSERGEAVVGGSSDAAECADESRPNPGPTGDETAFLASGPRASAAVGELVALRSAAAPTPTATAPSNTAAPTISGTPQAGQTLTASTGSWAGTTPMSYGFQWHRCDTSGANCVAISGATLSSYEPAASDVGSTLRVVVTASNSAGAASASSPPTAVIQASASTSGFVQRNGKTLVLNGQPFRFTGLNIYSANSQGRCGPTFDLDSSLSDWGGGGRVLRAWFFQNLATTNGVRDWSAFDHTLAVAKAHGDRVIVTLANQWADCDQGYGYKNETWYSSGYKSKDPEGTVSYRDYVAEIVTRYRNDPTVLMWQLMNEAEDKTSLTGSCPSDAAQVLKTWATDVSGLIKSLDPNHLVDIGTMGGGPCGTSYTEFQSVHDIPTVDLCEVHDYGSPGVPMPGDQYNGIQAEIDFCSNLNKPIFVGETGINLESEAGGSMQTRASDFNSKFSAQFAAGVVGELVWNWNANGSGGYDVGPGDPTLGVVEAY